MRPPPRLRLAAGLAVGLTGGLTAAGLAGCASAGRLAAPAGRFQAAADATSEAVLAYLTAANRVQRGARFAEAAADPTLPVTDSLYLRPVFSAGGVATRAAALDAVGAYAARLATLAGAKRGEPLATASKALGAQLTTLGAAAGGPEAGVARYGAPLAALAGALGELWAERRRERALRVLVPRAAPAVDTVLGLLAADLALAARVRRLSAEGRWRELSAEYNVRRLTATAAERARLLAELRDAADAYEADRAPAPIAAVTAMRAAHAALVRAARRGEATSDVLGAVELFATRARQARALADAFRGAARPTGS